MSKRENQIRQELAILKIELNSKLPYPYGKSNYGAGRYEEESCQKIFDKIVELKEELKSLNQNKDENN